MKYIMVLITFAIIINVQAVSLLDKKVKLNSSKDDLRNVFIAILQQTGIPVLYEGCPQEKTLVNIPKTSGTVKEILNALSGSKYRWSLKDGVLLFQDKEFIEEPYYPLKRYRFNFSVDTEDLQKYLEKTTFFDDLWQERINNWGMRLVYTSERSFKKAYKESSLRDIFLDLLKDSNNFCMIYKYSHKDSIATYKIVKESKDFDYNLIKDAEKSFYGLTSRSYCVFPLKKAFLPETILDGHKQLKCSLSFFYSDLHEAALRVKLKNISNKLLDFKDFKEENLIILDLAYRDELHKSAIGTFLIYPSLTSDISENFKLKPAEEKTFNFILKGSRYSKYDGCHIFDIGSEKKYSYRPDKVKVLINPHSYNAFRLMVYFYDAQGNKYKTISKDFIDTAKIRR